MQVHLDWEFALVEQLCRDDNHDFFVIQGLLPAFGRLPFRLRPPQRRRKPSFAYRDGQFVVHLADGPYPHAIGSRNASKHAGEASAGCQRKVLEPKSVRNGDASPGHNRDAEIAVDHAGNGL